jgi:hypothetical protein
LILCICVGRCRTTSEGDVRHKNRLSCKCPLKNPVHSTSVELGWSEGQVRRRSPSPRAGLPDGLFSNPKSQFG